MSDPNRPSSWRSQPASATRKRRMSAWVIASVTAGTALVIALGLWANALAIPVHRGGRPTTSVSPLPLPTTAQPTATASSGTTKPTESSSAKTISLPKVKSSGKFYSAAVDVPATGSAGKLRRYAVLVETSTKLDADRVGKQIAGVLNDPRSWDGSGNVRFGLVANESKADFTITLASPGTAKKACAPEPSTCLDEGDVVIDASYWLSAGPKGYPSKAEWQAYLVNHATGHLLGEPHQSCSKEGKPAPAMLPQEGGLVGCTPNPWPFP